MTPEREPFIVHCAKCKHEWAPCFLPAPVDVAARAMGMPCPACGHKKMSLGIVPRTVQDGDLTGWLTSGDTGISSLTIYAALTGRTPGGYWHPDVPYDPDDFGRCYRLLKVMPSWRERLSEVATRYPAWARLVERWDDIVALYERELPTGRAPKCYALIRELRGEER